ncbi:MAG: M56 family metallopeptidase [Bacteroidales bacterium]|nr:M56 family metallopeptidase [Bacteroidales bacterium]
MNNYFEYLIQSFICLACLYSLYWLLLRKETFFVLNRIYLVSSVLLSVLIPLFKISFDSSQTGLFYSAMLETVTYSGQSISRTINNSVPTINYISVIYFTGVIVFLIRFVFQIFQIRYFIKKYGVSLYKGTKVIYIGKKYSTFSFFNIIFINNENIADEKLDKIIAHENIHVCQKHSIDVIFLEILCIFQWFNPFVWFYKHSIKEVHEYLADDGVLSQGYNKVNYQNLLFSLITGMRLNEITNNFNHSLIKKRFIMMTKSKSAHRAKFKLLLVLPLIVMLIFAFSVTTSKSVTAQNKNLKKENVKTEKKKSPRLVKVSETEKDQNQEEVFLVVEKPPKYPGGESAKQSFFKENLKYPKAAKEKGIQGTVYVTFVVENDGSITNIQLLRGVDPLLDNEAIRVMKSMPKWEPGTQRGKKVRVQVNLPIKFALSKNKEQSNKE